MKAKHVRRITFSDQDRTSGKTPLASQYLKEWLCDNPETEILNISDYCDSEDIRFIIVYYKGRRIIR